MTVEEPLAGGFGNLGAVVRVGDTVRRPPRRSTVAVRALLVHLEQVGFDGVPRYLETDAQGREVLTYIEGDAPGLPYPAWAMTDDALVSFAVLLRRFHEAVASFDPASVTGWELDWADPSGGPMICHNDDFPENVVFRDGRAVALIDFDMAAPGRPFWELAIASQPWMPMCAPESRLGEAVGLDAVARFGRFARAYGVAPEQAVELVDVVFDERAQSIANIRSEIASGDPVWTASWRDAGGDDRAARDDAWLEAQRVALIAAVEG